MRPIDSFDLSVHRSEMKTFDIKTPSGLLLKLRYDIVRLQNAVASRDVRYAAFDCAMSAWHLTDWLLASVDDQRFAELTGVQRNMRGASKGFIDRNEHRLAGLRDCQLIANTGKHLVLTMPNDPSLRAKTTVRFDPPFNAADPASWERVKVRAVAYISRGDQFVDGLDFFTNLERQWRHVLVDEGFLSLALRDQELDELEGEDEFDWSAMVE